MRSVSDLFRGAECVQPEPPNWRTGYVYVLMLMCPDHPVFKIGFARDISARMGTIQPELPFDSCVLFAFWHENALGQEAFMHEYYAEYRLRGEWFRLPLETIFELERWGEVMAAKTPPGKLDQAPNWRQALSWYAPEVLVRLMDEFPDEVSSKAA